MRIARSSGLSEVVAASEHLFQDVRELILATREKVAYSVNSVLTLHYWQIGQRIRKDILQERRAGYGHEILPTLSAKLVIEFGRGYAQRNLANMIRLAEVFPDRRVVAVLSQQLGWSHFVEIIPLKDPLQRDFYAEMCRIERWSVGRLARRLHEAVRHARERLEAAQTALPAAPASPPIRKKTKRK